MLTHFAPWHFLLFAFFFDLDCWDRFPFDFGVDMKKNFAFGALSAEQLFFPILAKALVKKPVAPLALVSATNANALSGIAIIKS